MFVFLVLILLLQSPIFADAVVIVIVTFVVVSFTFIVAVTVGNCSTAVATDIVAICFLPYVSSRS